MIRLPHLAQRLALASARIRRSSAVSLLLVAGLAGCHRKQVAYTIPHGALAPVDLEPIPLPESPDLIATLPTPELEPLPIPPPPPKPAARKRPTPKEDAQPQGAGAPETAALAIGALSAGGAATQQTQQQAQGLIDSIFKRIAALPAYTADTQKKQVRQIRNFVDQAQKALNSGDAEGANNLATKARLLMDDLEKK